MKLLHVIGALKMPLIECVSITFNSFSQLHVCVCAHAHTHAHTLSQGEEGLKAIPEFTREKKSRINNATLYHDTAPSINSIREALHEVQKSALE